jgi:hypothetical protein
MAIEWQEPQLRSMSDQANLEEKLMSTSAVSSSSLNQQLQSYFQTRNSDVQQLGQALQSGNLSSAQVAFNNVTALGQAGPFASGNAFRGPQRQQDFDAIGQALQSGDLAGAQAAFAALKATAQGTTTSGPVINQGAGTASSEIVINLSGAAGGSGGTSGGATGPEIVLNLSNTSGSTNPEELNINIAQTSGGGEQVSFSIGNQGSSQGTGQTSSPDRITFNLNPNSNEQIVLNLLNAPVASTSTSSTSGASSSSPASGGLSVSA